MNSKLQKLDEECRSLSSDCTTKEEMLNYIHGFLETDTDGVASDLESHNQDNDLDIPESTVNGSKDAGYVITSIKQDDTPHGNNEDSAVLQWDATATLSYTHENGMHENSEVTVQGNASAPINLTPQNNSSVFISSYVKIIPSFQDVTIKTQDNNMEVAFPVTCAIPSTSHYTAAFNPSNTAIEGDYIDYHISIAQQCTMPDFQSTDHTMLHVPLQDFKNESSNSSNNEANAIPPAQGIYVDPEMIVSSNYNADYEMEGGQYVDYDTAIQQGIGQSVHLEQKC